MRNIFRLGLAVLAIFSSFAASAGYAFNFPDPVTPIARETLHMHNLVMVVILILFFLVFGLLIYSFRTHSKSAGFKASKFSGPTSRKQWLWVLSPFALLFFIDYVVFGIPAFHAVVMYEDTKTDAELVVKVTGSQWLWEYEYPAEGVSFPSKLKTPRDQIDSGAAKGPDYLLEVDNPLVLPVGKKVRFITTSNDVIHSWWVPAFGVKRDAVPGFLREFWATVEKTGTYRGQCSELCGKEHGFMPVVVNVVSQEEFATWMAAKKAALKPAAPVAAAEPAAPASAAEPAAPVAALKSAVVAKAAAPVVVAKAAQ
jgi:cytochrome c oxidase subunit 2